MSGTPTYWYFITGACTLAGAFGGAFFGQLLARRNEAARGKKRDAALLRSMLAEIQYAAELAYTYVESDIKTPAYRFHSKVYDAALPQLAGSCLSGEDVDKVIRFYSQLAQLNWGLEEVADIQRQMQGPAGASAELTRLFRSEVARLVTKASAVQRPDGHIFTAALQAVSRHLKPSRA